MNTKTFQARIISAFHWRRAISRLAVVAGVMGAVMGAEAQTITSSSTNTYWWRGLASGDPATVSNWSTNDSPTGTSSGAPLGNTGTGSYGIGIFNISATNNVAEVVTAVGNSGNVSAGGFIINNSNSTAIFDSGFSINLNGFTNNGTAYGIVANPGAGQTFITGVLPITSQTWLNNGGDS